MKSITRHWLVSFTKQIISEEVRQRLSNKVKQCFLGGGEGAPLNQSIHQCPIEISSSCVELQIAACVVFLLIRVFQFQLEMKRMLMFSQLKYFQTKFLVILTESSRYFQIISNSISCGSKLSWGQRPIAKQLKKRLKLTPLTRLSLSSATIPVPYPYLIVLRERFIKNKWKQARKLSRCDSYLQNLKTLPTHWLTDRRGMC